MGASGLGRLLVEEGLIQEFDRKTIRKTSGNNPAAFAKGVVALGLFEEEDLASFIAEFTSIRRAPKSLLEDCDHDAFGYVDPNLICRLEVLPLSCEKKVLSVAMADPLDLATVRQLEFFTGLKVKPVVATTSQIRQALSVLVEGFKTVLSPLENFLNDHADSAAYHQRSKNMRAEPESKGANTSDGFDIDSMNFESNQQDEGEFEDLDDSFDDLSDEDEESLDFSMDDADENDDEMNLDDLTEIDGDDDDALTSDISFDEEIESDSDAESLEISPEDSDAPEDSDEIELSTTATIDESAEALEETTEDSENIDLDAIGSMEMDLSEATADPILEASPEMTDEFDADPGMDDLTMDLSAEPDAEVDELNMLEDLPEESETTDVDAAIANLDDEDDIPEEQDDSTETDEAQIEPVQADQVLHDQFTASFNRAMFEISCISSKDELAHCLYSSLSKVSADGAVIAVQEGKASITASWQNNEFATEHNDINLEDLGAKLSEKEPGDFGAVSVSDLMNGAEQSIAYEAQSGDKQFYLVLMGNEVTEGTKISEKISKLFKSGVASL